MTPLSRSDGLPEEIQELIEHAKKWKQRLTTDLGPGRHMAPEIAMYDNNARFLGDIEFQRPIGEYDMMNVGLTLCGLVMAFDIRYLMFSTEALMYKYTDFSSNKREDGTIKAPSMSLIRGSDGSSIIDATQAWIEGDESVIQTLLVCVADTKLGRTWSFTIPFEYEIGKRVRWLPQVEDATYGPDYRSELWGALLLPAVVRSQYDYLLIRPDPAEAIEYMFSSDLSMSIADGTSIASALVEMGTHMISMEEIEDIRREHEEMINQELSDLPDTVPDDWSNS